MSPVFDPDNPEGTHVKITPKTDSQIAEENLWPAGDYDFEVTKAVEKVSKSGNPMIQVDLMCYNGEKRRAVTDYIMEKMAFKLKHFLYGIGMTAAYEAGEFSAEQFQGRAGKVTLRQEQQEGYLPKMVVKDYVVPKEGEAKPAPKRTPVATEQDDSVPF